MSKSWEEVWPEIATAVRASGTRDEATARACKVLGRRITYDALQRSWKRYTGESILSALGAGQVQETWSLPEAPIYNDVEQESELPSPPPPPWYRTPRTWTFPEPVRILVIPDTQVMPGVPLSHFTALGHYAAAKQPEVIIHLGDFRDMPSLSSYESPTKKAVAGRCKAEDIESGNRAIELFENELAREPGYKPIKIMLEGNHDAWNEYGRIGRYLAEHPDDRKLFEKVPLLERETGWEVIPFLEPIEVAGVLYCHLFPYSAKGTITRGSLGMGAASAAAQVKAVMQSATAGHKQGIDEADVGSVAGRKRGLIVGSCYQHTDSYMPGANFWRGAIMKSRCKGGDYQKAELCMEYLLEKHL